MKDGFYWVISKMYDIEGYLLGEPRQTYYRVAQVWTSPALGEKFVYIPGFDTMKLSKAEKSFNFLEEVKPCSI